MIPDYIYVLCAYCHSKIISIAKEISVVICDCGQEVHNPYYKDTPK